MKPYETWTKTALIAELRRLESLSPSPPLAVKQISKKQAREFDFSKYGVRPIALKIAYLGWNYHGLAEVETVETIESHLFAALERAKLIPDRKLCQYARCGRTDKGVSSFGQVVSLLVRSKWNNSSVKWPHLGSSTIAHEAMETTSSIEEEEELPYPTILNRLLPNDIRVIAWSPVSPSFHARFSCTYRHYNYFFNASGLNLTAMQEAASFLVGPHDFRHFCKIDTSKKDAGYERTILSASIEDVPFSAGNNCVTAPANGFKVFSIKGTAFLWHQVRCIMAVLLLVGQGKEQPSVVQDLLNLSLHPADAGRPIYTIADDKGLVLADCGYAPGQLEWRSEQGSDAKVAQKFHDQWQEWAVKSVLSDYFLQRMGGLTVLTTKGKHVPIMHRHRCDSLEERQKKSMAFKKQKLNDLNEE